MTATIVPANPGFWLLGVVLDEHSWPDEVTRTPIIAWQVDHDDLFVKPISACGLINHPSDDRPVQYPDGQVDARSTEDMFADAEAWLQHVQSEATARNSKGLD